MTKNIVNNFIGFGLKGFYFGLLLSIGYPALAQTLPPVENMLAERIQGKVGAPLEVIEYASLTCPHCAAFYNGPWPALKKEFVDTGKVKFVYRDFPTDQVALAASMIARCAPKERYFGIIELMFRTQDNWRRSTNPKEDLANIGRLAGMSLATIEACMRNQAVYDGVMKQRNAGIEKYNIDSTPTLIVNGKKIEGGLRLEEFRQVFNKALTEVGRK